MQRTAVMVSKFFANPTLASKFFIVFVRSSSSLFTSAKKTRRIITKTCIQRVGGTLRSVSKNWLQANRDLSKRFNRTMTTSHERVKILNKLGGKN